MSIDESEIPEDLSQDGLDNVDCVYVLRSEIFDKDISDGELRQLLALRSIAPDAVRTDAGLTAIAVELGVHTKTAARRMRSLERLGYIACTPRGYGQTAIKTINVAKNSKGDR